MPTYFIRGAEEITSRDNIRHFVLGNRQVVESESWLPDKPKTEIVLTCGASCPDAILDEVLLRVLSFFEGTRIVDDVLSAFPPVEASG